MDALGCSCANFSSAQKVKARLAGANSSHCFRCCFVCACACAAVAAAAFAALPAPKATAAAAAAPKPVLHVMLRDERRPPLAQEAATNMRADHIVQVRTNKTKLRSQTNTQEIRRKYQTKPKFVRVRTGERIFSSVQRSNVQRAS